MSEQEAHPTTILERLNAYRVASRVANVNSYTEPYQFYNSSRVYQGNDELVTKLATRYDELFLPRLDRTRKASEAYNIMKQAPPNCQTPAKAKEIFLRLIDRQGQSLMAREKRPKTLFAVLIEYDYGDWPPIFHQIALKFRTILEEQLAKPAKLEQMQVLRKSKIYEQLHYPNDYRDSAELSGLFDLIISRYVEALVNAGDWNTIQELRHDSLVEINLAAELATQLNREGKIGQIVEGGLIDSHAVEFILKDMFYHFANDDSQDSDEQTKFHQAGAAIGRLILAYASSHPSGFVLCGFLGTLYRFRRREQMKEIFDEAQQMLDECRLEEIAKAGFDQLPNYLKGSAQYSSERVEKAAEARLDQLLAEKGF